MTRAHAKSGPLLLVTNKADHTLTLVDPESATAVAVIDEEGVTGHEVAASLDGTTAYVPIYGNSGVGGQGTDGQYLQFIDLASRKIVSTLDFGRGVRPHHPVVNPVDGLLYVTTEIEDSVTVIDPATKAVVGTIPTGKPQTHMLALSHDGERGYTANVASGTVSVLDLRARTLVTVIQAAPKTQRISVSPDDRWVVTADQTKLRLVVIDAKTNEIAFSIPLPALGFGTAFTQEGLLLATMPAVNKVAVIDLQAKKVIKTVETPKTPQELLVRPDGKVVYVSCDTSASVLEILTANWTAGRTIKAGALADGLAWAK